MHNLSILTQECPSTFLHLPEGVQKLNRVTKAPTLVEPNIELSSRADSESLHPVVAARTSSHDRFFRGLLQRFVRTRFFARNAIRRQLQKLSLDLSSKNDFNSRQNEINLALREPAHMVRQAASIKSDDLRDICYRVLWVSQLILMTGPCFLAPLPIPCCLSVVLQQ